MPITEDFLNVIHTTNEFITTYGAFCSLLMDRGIVSYCSMIVYLQLTEIHKITIIKLSNRAFKFDRISANDLYIYIYCYVMLHGMNHQHGPC